MNTNFWTHKLNRRKRIRLYLSRPHIRQTRPLRRLTEWWINR